MIEQNKNTFKNVYPHDLLWMNINDVSNVITNTFESKILLDTNKFKIIESNWHFLDTDNEFNRYRLSKMENSNIKVYFHILENIKTDSFLILRAKDTDTIKIALSKSQEKTEYPIKDKKDNYENGNSFSTIIERKKLVSVYYSFAPIYKVKNKIVDSTFINDQYYSFNSMNLDVDISIDNNNPIEYFSDLLISSKISVYQQLYPNSLKTY